MLGNQVARGGEEGTICHQRHVLVVAVDELLQIDDVVVVLVQLVEKQLDVLVLWRRAAVTSVSRQSVNCH
jgi:hypothetical protein